MLSSCSSVKIKSVPDFSGFSDPNFTLSAPFKVGDEEVLTPRNKYTLGADYTEPDLGIEASLAWNRRYAGSNRRFFYDYVEPDHRITRFNFPEPAPFEILNGPLGRTLLRKRGDDLVSREGLPSTPHLYKVFGK